MVSNICSKFIVKSLGHNSMHSWHLWRYGALFSFFSHSLCLQLKNLHLLTCCQWAVKAVNVVVNSVNGTCKQNIFMRHLLDGVKSFSINQDCQNERINERLMYTKIEILSHSDDKNSQIFISYFVFMNSRKTN